MPIHAFQDPSCAAEALYCEIIMRYPEARRVKWKDGKTNFFDMEKNWSRSISSVCVSMSRAREKFKCESARVLIRCRTFIKLYRVPAGAVVSNLKKKSGLSRNG